MNDDFILLAQALIPALHIASSVVEWGRKHTITFCNISACKTCMYTVQASSGALQYVAMKTAVTNLVTVQVTSVST